MSRGRGLALGLAAVALAALALWLGRRSATTLPPPREAASPPAVARPELPRPVRTPSLPPPAPEAAPLPAPPATPPRVELPWELEEVAERYRSASEPEERADALLEIGLSDDPRALEFLLDELEAARVEEQEPILDGVIQFGSRDAIQRLNALAKRTADPEAREALEDAVEYLALPSLTELRRGQVELGSGDAHR